MAATLICRSPRLEITPMRPEDIDFVLDIERSTYIFPWTRGNFEDSLVAGYSARLIRDGNELLGYAVMMQILDEAHLLNISIIPERQHEGLGSLLLEALFEEARAYGALRMVLEVRQANLDGRAFYLRHGFTQIGERREYYPAQKGREAALVLEKEI